MDATTSSRASRALVVAPLVLAVAATVALLVVPTGREASGGGSPAGVTASGTRSSTLVQSDGWTVLLPLAVPVLLAAAPTVLRRPRARRAALLAAGVLLPVFVILAAASIGLFYAPAALAMVVAAIRSGTARGTSAGSSAP